MGQISTRVRNKKYLNNNRFAKRSVDENRYDEAINLYRQIEYKLRPFDTSDIQNSINEIFELKRIEAEMRGKAKEENAAFEIEQRLNAGLIAFLNERNLNGDLKIKEIKICKSKTEKWLKESNREKLNEQEIADITSVLARIFTSLKEKDKKPWMICGEGIWKDVAKWVVDGEMEKMFSDIISKKV